MAKNPPPLVHFIGIGGIGISALARWFLARNWAVSGSDLIPSSTTRELQKEGANIKIKHKKTNVPKDAAMVVYNEAIRTSNDQTGGKIELIEAERRGLRPMSYPEVIGCLTKVYDTLGVTGSHGKSTTTALLGLMLKNANLDPNIIVGTKLKELNGKNFRAGRSNWLVLEADDYKAVFLNYFPMAIIGTTLDREHLDVYGNLQNIKHAFLHFFENVKEGGVLVLNKDDKNLYSLRSPVLKIAKNKKVKVIWYSIKNNSLSNEIRHVIKVPGEHNVGNATAAATLALEFLKIKKSIILKTIANYRGAWRRMEYKGKFRTSGVTCQVFDDYAHHPTEIKATLAGLREKYPKNQIICVYEPHQTKRLKALWPEFQTAFKNADKSILLPVYEVAGRDSAKSKFTSKKLVEEIKKRNSKKEIYYLENPKEIKSFIATILKATSYKPETIVVMMGAGNIANYTPLLFR